jgi:arylformamidase
MQSNELAWREREYSPSSAIGGNYAPHIDRYKTESKQARSALTFHADLPYGESARTRIDFFPPLTDTANGGLLVFIHGGYWQELSKEDSAFLAPTWCAAGFAHAVVGYTLAPEASVAEIVEECRSAVRWLAARSEQLGFDVSRIVVAGSSAGAYLAAACAAERETAVRGLVLLSGIYDVRPLIGTSINVAIGLDAKSAAELDLFVTPPRCSSIVAWGEIETSEFKRQSRAFAVAIEEGGARVELFEIAGRNHFDVVHELGDAQAPLFQAAVALFN